MTKLLERTEPRQILEHCDSLGLDSHRLSACLAVNPRIIQHWRDGTAQPNGSGLRSLGKLETIHQLAIRLLKKDAMKIWFSSPNETLGGERPVALLSLGALDRVRNVLGMLEWGIYS